MKAFGSSGEEFQVPKSGRRSTNLLAGLCDLSEFITRSGASADSYFHGFAGDSPSPLCGDTLKPDTQELMNWFPIAAWMPLEFDFQEKQIGILSLT